MDLVELYCSVDDFVPLFAYVLSLAGTMAGIQLVTRLKSTMKNVLMDSFDKLALYKRGIIESVNARLKIGCQIDHHRHRSLPNFLVNLISSLVSYSLDPHKPRIGSLAFKNYLL